MPKKDMCLQRIQMCFVKITNLSFPHLYNTGLLLGTTTTFNILVTHVRDNEIHDILERYA
jgi:hypothetical protein